MAMWHSEQSLIVHLKKENHKLSVESKEVNAGSNLIKTQLKRAATTITLTTFIISQTILLLPTLT